MSGTTLRSTPVARTSRSPAAIVQLPGLSSVRLEARPFWAPPWARVMALERMWGLLEHWAPPD